MTYAVGARAVKPETVGSKTTLLGARAQETGEIPMAINDTVTAAFNKYSGNVLTFLGALVPIGALVGMFWLLTRLTKDGSGSLALLAIGGVVVLILLLTAVAMVFKILGLTNDTQAMGLPEGSIRAVIALSLIVLFAILSVFLYQGVSTGPTYTIERITETQRTEFFQSRATARDVQSKALMDKDGTTPLKNADGKALYDVSYHSANSATSDDFAKQMLVLLGTLMTAVTSFYLGAGTATTAAKAGETKTAGPPPTVSSISPTSHSIDKNGPSIPLQIMGANLNGITHVKIVRAGAGPIIGTNVHSSPTSVTCDIPVSTATTPPGGLPWDVVVDDGGTQSFTLPGALTITP
jgi:hypothetical protein